MTDFIEGKLCRNCGKTKRYKNSGKCVYCIYKRGVKYRAENTEKVKLRKKKYYEENKEAISEKYKIWAVDNKEHLTNYNKNYWRDNKERLNIRHKEYVLENKEHIQQTSRDYYQTNKNIILEGRKNKYDNMGSAEKDALLIRQYAHREKRLANMSDVELLAYNKRVNERSATNYQKNKQKRLIQSNEWRKNNPEKTRAAKQRRRAKVAKNGGSFTSDEWLKLYEFFSGHCVHPDCLHEDNTFPQRGNSTHKAIHADHINPISNGGTSFISNIQPLCANHNTQKGVGVIDYRWYAIKFLGLDLVEWKDIINHKNS